MDATGGSITIDGVNTSTIGLLSLRRSMAVVPQEPLLIHGSVRQNLDPFGHVDDHELRAVLKKVGLPIRKLESDEDAARLLSAGERQMLSLARAMLKPANIVVCDEPTSNIDNASDRWIQDVLRREFKGKTVVTIAHRLDTIVRGYDKIIVMDEGRVVECDSPSTLLRDKSSALFGMAHRAGGDDAVARLLAMIETENHLES